MKPDEFLEQFQCKFAVSERDQILYERIEKYFKTTDNAGFHVSVGESKRLKKWAHENGYSDAELRHAKQIVDRLP